MRKKENMRPISISGYGEIEVKSKREAARLEKFLAQNPHNSAPTHKIKVKIEGYIDYGNVAAHDGIGQPFGMSITKALVEDF
jgi:adenylyl- and sulfurtransferase ThiI